MIEEPGSFSGICQLAEAAARARGQPAHVVGDLHQRAGEGLERAVQADQRVVPGERGELVGGGDEGQAGQAGDVRRAGDGVAFGWVLRPVPTAVPPSASS
jgi:hypothetical protein